jgi:hypothetical protein
MALLLVSWLAPAMACMVPDAQMTAEERSCCQTMHDECGQTDMPASHGCCQKTPLLSLLNNALDTKAVAFHPAVVQVAWLPVSHLVNSDSAVAGWLEHSDYSPPQSPPSTVSILRI